MFTELAGLCMHDTLKIHFLFMYSGFQKNVRKLKLREAKKL